MNQGTGFAGSTDLTGAIEQASNPAQQVLSNAVSGATHNQGSAPNADVVGGPSASAEGDDSQATSEPECTVHVVEDGQHLSAIAERYHFANMETIWNAPENAGLRAVREDPHQLLPGDQVVIPKVRKARFVRPTGQMHEFIVHVEKLKLRLKVLDIFGEPIANEEGTIQVDGQEIAARTDGDGLLEVRIPRSAAKAILKIGSREFELKIGGMPPVSESLGVQARLSNLGFCAGGSDPDAEVTPAQADLLTAIDRFRSLHDVGEAADDLADKLIEEYGS